MPRHILTACVAASLLVVGSGTVAHIPAAPPKSKPTGPASPANFWSFQPLRSIQFPKVHRAAWVRSPVDTFILSALENKALTPAAPLDRRKLIRRVYFDLLGLPPKPDEINAFVSDAHPHAYERLVDRLLASPHYGERWGRHWLDVARYADSDGLESDEDRPTAYHYRDFVIKALNDDMPYNTFVKWQLAGGDYEPDNPLAEAATGFITAGTHAVLGENLMEEEKVRERYNELDDMISTTGQAFLGLTLGCARCHDHKYDPVSTRDYYRIAAIFNSGDRAQIPLIPRAEAAKLQPILNEWQAQLDAAKKAKNSERVKELEAKRPTSFPTAYGLADSGAIPRESWLLERGDFHRKKEKVEPGFLAALTRSKPVSEYLAEARASITRDDSSFQRRALAEWMTDTKDGAGALLARVIVNRLWQGHFGEGLVRTVNDFGKRGEAPSHPELLEWLAFELVRGGWKLKPIHRMILLSAAYREGDALNVRCAKVDPESRLLWRRKPRRIEAEIYRDSMLSVAGSLNLKMYGPAYKPPIQKEAMQARNVQSPYPTDAKDNDETRRRTVYMFHKRVTQYPLSQAFDAPDASATCGRRAVTTVAPQALAVLNEPFIRLRAGEFARRVQTEASSDPAAQVRRAYALALGRMPSQSELAASAAFLTRRTAAHLSREPGVDGNLLALSDFCQAIFGLNEFVYVD